MGTRLDLELRDWILSKPGLFRNDSRDGLLQDVLRAFGVSCDVCDFEAAMKRVGYEPIQRGNLGNYYWILAFPKFYQVGM